MCGINGILYFNSYCEEEPRSFFESCIKKMNDEISHRGPDGEGMLISYPMCFGFRRLSIIDLSENGNQPMFNEDGSIALIFNGEIYNYKELIPELKSKGHIFKTRCDTEVIIHSYEEYGFDCIKKFNGMWAFAIYDFKRNILFCSRDRLGVKPFYYYLDERNFIFSSEIKAILKIKNNSGANHGKVFDYLAYGYKTSNGETFFKDINELKPAHNIIISGKEIKILKFWDFKSGEEKRNDNNKSKLSFLLEDSVKLRFRSDVPVSILLSGGLDSSIIAAIADELIGSNEIKNKQVTAYSAVFPGFQFDESGIISEFLKSCNHIKSVHIIPDFENLPDTISDFVYGMGEPVFNTTSFAHYSLMKEIKKDNVKVVMNGQGADEAWCGYDKYILGYYLLDLLISSPQKFLSGMNDFNKKKNYSYKYILSQTVKAIISRRYSSYLRSAYREKIFGCLSRDFKKTNYSYFKNPVYEKFSSGNLSGYLKNNIQYQGFNQILHYEDHSSMLNSIEMRSPFIDYRIMEFAFEIPSEEKLGNGITKKILREVFKDKLPKSILNNKQKIGFVTPFEKNFIEQNRMKQFVDDLMNSDSFKSKTIFDTGKIKKIFGEKKSYPEFPFWRIINLELWSQVYNIKNL